MVGKFETTIEFKYGTNELEVCGPIFWDMPADTELTIRVEVELKQGNYTEHKVSDPPPFKPLDDEWMVIINPSNLAPGTAIGRARAIDTETNQVVAEWNSPVKIDRPLTFVAVRNLIAASANGALPEIGEAPPQREWQEFFEQDWPAALAPVGAVAG
jgi:hypothetical protein